jgi:hypothetical protein
MKRIEIAAVVGLVFATGCRTVCMADEEASPEQIAKERRAAGRAQTLCKELQRPRVALVDERLVLSATREVTVAERSQVPNDGTSFEPLFVRLDRYKRHYRTIWPADPFEPFATVELDPALEAPRAMSVLKAVSGSGFGAMRIRVSDAQVDVRWPACGTEIEARARDAATARDLVSIARAACVR